MKLQYNLETFDRTELVTQMQSMTQIENFMSNITDLRGGKARLFDEWVSITLQAGRISALRVITFLLERNLLPFELLFSWREIQCETNMILKKQQVHSDVAENHGDETLNADTAGSLK